MKNGCKKIMLAVLLAISLVISCGCANLKANIKINANGSADVNLSFMVDDNVLSMMGGESVFDDMKAGITGGGYRAKLVKANNQTGYQYTAQFKSLDEMMNEKTPTGNLIHKSFAGKDGKAKIYTVKHGFFKDDYSIDAHIDMSHFTDSSDSDDTSQAMMEAMLSKIDYELKLELPVKVASNNATKLENGGKTLVWNVEYGKDNEIKFSFASYNVAHLLMVGIPVAVVILALIVLLIVLAAKKKKKSKALALEAGYEEEAPIEGEIIAEETMFQPADAETSEQEADDVVTEETVVEDVVTNESETEEITPSKEEAFSQEPAEDSTVSDHDTQENDGEDEE